MKALRTAGQTLIFSHMCGITPVSGPRLTSRYFPASPPQPHWPTSDSSNIRGSFQHQSCWTFCCLYLECPPPLSPTSSFFSSVSCQFNCHLLRRQRIRLQCGRPGFDPWVGKIPWRRERLPTPVFRPGETHEQRSLAGYSPRGHKESDTTEAT